MGHVLMQLHLTYAHYNSMTNLAYNLARLKLSREQPGDHLAHQLHQLSQYQVLERT